MPAYITKKFGFKKQKISYLKNTPKKKIINLQSKLKDEDIKGIVNMAKNQLTSYLKNSYNN